MSGRLLPTPEAEFEPLSSLASRCFVAVAATKQEVEREVRGHRVRGPHTITPTKTVD